MTAEPDIVLREELKQRVANLKLYGLLAHWDDIATTEMPWLQRLVQWEEVIRKRRGLERRLGAAHIGRFKALAQAVR